MVLEKSVRFFPDDYELSQLSSPKFYALTFSRFMLWHGPEIV
jgi:hypothetical protein